MVRKGADAVRITTARRGHSADIRRREIRYLVSMGIRTACFVLAIVTDGPWRWVLVAAAFVLPYIAVVLANAGQSGDTGGPPSTFMEERPAIEASEDDSARVAGEEEPTGERRTTQTPG